MAMSGPVCRAVRSKLSQLNPAHLEVINESHMHNVPRDSESHLKVVVVCDQFVNKPLLQRHRMVNSLLKEELENNIHALSIVARTPDQWQKCSDVAPSPSCMGEARVPVSAVNVHDNATNSPPVHHRPVQGRLNGVSVRGAGRRALASARLRRVVAQQRRTIRRLRGCLAALRQRNWQLRRLTHQQHCHRQPSNTPLDPAALVADITQAAHETAAILDQARQTADTADNTTEQDSLQYEPATGLYYDRASGYYWDNERRMYYDGCSGLYLKYDSATNQYSYVTTDAPVQPTVTDTSPSTLAATAAADDDEVEDGEIVDVEEGERCNGDSDVAVWTSHAHDCTAATVDETDNTQPQQADPQCQWSPLAGDNCAAVQRDACLYTDNDQAASSSDAVTSAITEESPWLRMIVQQSQVDDMRVGSLFVVTIDGATVGRDSNHQVCLNESLVSKFHAQISYQACQRQYRVRDLGSRNGTFVDDGRISSAKQESDDVLLRHGSYVQFGSTRLLCHVHSAVDYCLECDPGQVQAASQPAATLTRSADRTIDRQRERHLVVKRIKRKYGIGRVDGVASVAAGFSDRAAARRRTVGSSCAGEKTHTLDPSKPLADNNRGFQMLQKMGWRQGGGLGSQEQGDCEPVSSLLASKSCGVLPCDRAGLGCDSAAVSSDQVTQPTQRSVSSKRSASENVWRKTRQRFDQLS